jgi:hypothetical protein
MQKYTSETLEKWLSLSVELSCRSRILSKEMKLPVAFQRGQTTKWSYIRGTHIRQRRYGETIIPFWIHTGQRSVISSKAFYYSRKLRDCPGEDLRTTTTEEIHSSARAEPFKDHAQNSLTSSQRSGGRRRSQRSSRFAAKAILHT